MVVPQSKKTRTAQLLVGDVREKYNYIGRKQATRAQTNWERWREGTVFLDGYTNVGDIVVARVGGLKPNYTHLHDGL